MKTTIDRALQEALQYLISGSVFFDEPMTRHTSIGVGGKADALIFPRNREELEKLIGLLWRAGVTYLAVGNGTNLIVRDGGFRGVLICLRDMKGRSVMPGEGGVSLYAEAGIPLSEIVNITVDEALTGMEFCAGIPGSVGGGVRMNAGAYGWEMKDVVRIVTLINGTGRVRSVDREELRFSYRNLDLPESVVITGATFFLQRGSRETIKAKVDEIIGLRTSKHPLQYRSAGSIFKNPRPVPAGRLVDEAGLKGMRIGDAMVSEEHGNFIVNTGAAGARDIVALIELVEAKVLESSGVRLEREVRIIGEEEP
jgi:UDP-N-acetylmuramate dehydrogenase